jgi:arginyl-tRNA synthetase
MNSLEKIKQQIVGAINQALGKDLVKETDLVFPPAPKASEGKSSPELGDLSLPCFDLAKELKKSPIEISLMLAKLSELSSDRIGIESVKAVGPYLNFVLDKNVLTEELLKDIKNEKGKFGQNQSGKKQKVMIEYSNGNTHKELHVGHLRNICYGDAVSRIIAANGYAAIPVSYINDFGIHVAKTLWALEKFYKEKTTSKNRGAFLGEVYVKGSLESENDEAAKKEINQLMAKIESRKGAEYELWQTTRKWSIEQFAQIYKQLGIKFRDTFYESEVIDAGRKLVSQLLKTGVLKESQGAVIADLEKSGLGVLVFLRSDGTALYPVADLPLAAKKFKKYKLDESIYVVDIRQGQYFKQLFKVLELMGYKQKTIHLGYEFLKLPSGMMASRTGKVITFETFWTEAYKRASEETKKRHDDWSDKKIEVVAEKILVGAMKFEMVKVSRTAVITFDIEKALRFEGFTAAYIQYTFARSQSILRKSEVESPALPAGRRELKVQVKTQNLKEKKEHGLVMKLAKYPEAVKLAGEKYEPSEIAKYLFELAQEFNDYYHEVPVLKAGPETRAARLFLIGAVSQVLSNGLDLLGIETMEEM